MLWVSEVEVLLIGGGLFSVMMFVITSSTSRKAKKAQKTLFSTVKSKLLNDQHVNYCRLRILKHITFPSHVLQIFLVWSCCGHFLHFPK